MWSSSVNPVGIPVISSRRCVSSSIICRLRSATVFRGTRPERRRSSAMRKMAFSASSRIWSVVAAGRSAGGEDLLGCPRQLPQDPLLAHDLGVVLDVGGAGSAVREGGHVAGTAHRLQVSLPRQLVADRDQVERGPALGEGAQRLEDLAVTRGVEGLGGEQLLRAMCRCRLSTQDGAQHRRSASSECGRVSGRVSGSKEPPPTGGEYHARMVSSRRVRPALDHGKRKALAAAAVSVRLRRAPCPGRSDAQGRHHRLRRRRRAPGRAVDGGGQAPQPGQAPRRRLLRAAAAHEPSPDAGLLVVLRHRDESGEDGDLRLPEARPRELPPRLRHGFRDASRAFLFGERNALVPRAARRGRRRWSWPCSCCCSSACAGPCARSRPLVLGGRDRGRPSRGRRGRTSPWRCPTRSTTARARRCGSWRRGRDATCRSSACPRRSRPIPWRTGTCCRASASPTCGGGSGRPPSTRPTHVADGRQRVLAGAAAPAGPPGQDRDAGGRPLQQAVLRLRGGPGDRPHRGPRSPRPRPGSPSARSWTIAACPGASTCPWSWMPRRTPSRSRSPARAGPSSREPGGTGWSSTSP